MADYNRVFELLGLKPYEPFKLDDNDTIYYFECDLVLKHTKGYSNDDEKAFDIVKGEYEIIKKSTFTKEELLETKNWLESQGAMCAAEELINE